MISAQMLYVCRRQKWVPVFPRDKRAFCPEIMLKDRAGQGRKVILL
jgi:hypothetical protein